MVMADKNASLEHTAGRQWLILKFLLGVMLLLALITGTLAWLSLSGRSGGHDTLQENLKRSQTSSGFPLYYPVKMPDSFATEGSIDEVKEQAVVFTLAYDDKEVVVTQQPRPPLMEEVKKIRQFTTPLGEAYIANLNGAKAGFIVTERTLIIISSQDTIASEDLEQLLRSLGPV